MADTHFLPNCKKKGNHTNSQTLDFINFVYRDTAFDGQVMFAVKNSNGEFKPMGSCRCSQIADFAERMTIFSDFDYYISSNIFSDTNRSSENLLAVNSIVIDIDCHEVCYPDQLELRIEALVWRLQNDLFDCGDLPTPHCVVLTGRGVQLWWCLVPAYAPRFMGAFKHVEHHFASIIEELISEFPSELQGFHVDPVASSNAAGLFRLPGTFNTHCQKRVIVRFFSGPRLNLKDFRDQFLPVGTQAAYTEVMNCQPRIHRQNIPTGNLLKRLAVIEKLRNMRNSPVGKETRNDFCFAYYVAAKPFYGDSKAYQLTRDFNAGFKKPFTEKELKGCLHSARRKKYWYTTERFCELLDISPDEAERIGLRNSTPLPSAKERKRQRDAQIIDLFNKGYNQCEIADELHISRQTVNKVVRANPDKAVTLSSQIRVLKKGGKSNREISSELGCSLRTVERHIDGSGKCSTPVRSISRNGDKVSKNSPIYGLHFSEGEGVETAPAKEVTAPQEESTCRKQTVIDKLAASLPSLAAERLDGLNAHAYSSHDDFAGIDEYQPFRCGVLSFTENDAISAQADTALVRIGAAIIGCLRDALDRDGDLFIGGTELKDQVNGFLQYHSAPSRPWVSLTEQQVSSACNTLCQQGVIVMEKGNSEAYYYLADNYTYEKESAEQLCTLINAKKECNPAPAAVRSAIRQYETAAGITLSSEQEHAVTMALTEPVSIITGGPGTGKTSVTAAICGAVRFVCPTARIKACAPTGRAAVRLAEAIGIPAKTIHSLIGSQNKKFNCDYLIVDETSMVDMELLHRLLTSIGLSAHVIFVGDPAQLPCVGGGNVLRDMISSKLAAVTTLHQVYRQAQTSGIVAYADRITSVKYVDECLPACQNSISGDMCFLQYETRQDIESNIIEVVKRLVDSKAVQTTDISGFGSYSGLV